MGQQVEMLAAKLKFDPRIYSIWRKESQLQQVVPLSTP